MFPMEMQAKTRGTSVHFYYVQPPKEASGWSFPEAVRAHCVTSDGQLCGLCSANIYERPQVPAAGRSWS